MTLSKAQIVTARDMAVNAAILGVHNEPWIHYTQDWRRWEGIANDLKAWRGQFPRYADCSSFVTWCLWNALDHFHIGDRVNGEHWGDGYTGTMLQHGRHITGSSWYMRGDVAIYGPYGSTGSHAVILLDSGPPNDYHRVASHGSEAGPMVLNLRYRSDIMSIRRYIY